MILKWLQTVIGVRRGPENLAGPVLPGPMSSSTTPDSKLVDIAHEVLSKDLRGLEKYGWPFVKKQKFKQKVRTKVKHFLSIPLSAEDESEVVDEITERITEVAEVDHHYSHLFDGSEKKI